MRSDPWVRGPSSLFRGLKLMACWLALISLITGVRGPSSLFRGLKPSCDQVLNLGNGHVCGPRTLLVIQRTETHVNDATIHLLVEGHVVRGPSSLFRGLKHASRAESWLMRSDPWVRGPSSLFRGLKLMACWLALISLITGVRGPSSLFRGLKPLRFLHAVLLGYARQSADPPRYSED